LLEILAAPDGSGPLFRVAVGGGITVEGPTPSKAWNALFGSDKSALARTAGLSGGPGDCWPDRQRWLPV
jgi:hypothetical protein